ncbi:sn-glycerol 3-phosphate transport system substrate-binding protein [Ketogulonicigenium robustum]|uniref:sn-glycerol 3-phosphate transport system substrate-binding protein n=1 Tax=Ketogulonicigenium robustum TaxID=92947 RepID=A0A1W6NXN5_9RHOB|nr:ABC transporter substrate-binding protein [Ketogulonicigenium robustum]ARO13949.1 sn-glycerol 3-phosphate transport system substrate-binding protein [Ketogulonicigenium robustum]
MQAHAYKAALAGAAALMMTTAVAHADVTVEFWHSFNGKSGEALNEIIAAFEAENPDIKIEAQRVGNYEEIVTQLQAAIPAGRAPDAVVMEVTRYGLFAERGVLTDLSPYIDADPLKDDLYPFAQEIGVYNGKTYIVPFNSSTPVVYANRDIFARAGFADMPPLTTFDELQAAAVQIQDSLGAEGIWGAAAPGQFTRWGLVMGNGSEMIDRTTHEVLLDSPATIAAYQWMAGLVNDLKVAPLDTVTSEQSGDDAFVAGKIGMTFQSTGNFGDNYRALGDNLVVLPMPCNDGCAVPIGGAGIGILDSAPQDVKDAAYKFISFAANPQSNALWFASTGYMPINRLTADEPVAQQAMASQPGIDVAIKQLDYAYGRARPPVVTWMRTSEYDIWQAMALGQRDVTEAMTDFAARTREQADRLSR